MFGSNPKSEIVQHDPAKARKIHEKSKSANPGKIQEQGPLSMVPNGVQDSKAKTKRGTRNENPRARRSSPKFWSDLPLANAMRIIVQLHHLDPPSGSDKA